MSKVLYVAGPMTGIPHFNFPLFDAVSAVLRGQGYTIISPAETDHEQTRAAAMASLTGTELASVEGAETWGDCLARDVKMLADGFPVDTEECDADFRARLRAAQASADEAAKTREEGWTAPVLDPAGFVRRINRSLLTIDGLALLPNWEKSRGARLEAFVGLLTGKEYFTVEVVAAGPGGYGYLLHASSPAWVKSMLAKDWADAIKMHTPIKCWSTT